MSYVELLNHSDYEILDKYPYTIRRKYDGYEPVEWINNTGYPCIYLNQKPYRKHRLIALQFIENDDPDNKIEVDHKNKHRYDYHLENLEWVTESENKLNTTGRGNIKYEYLDELSEETFTIDSYETRNGIRYFDNGQYYYYYNEENNEIIFYGRVKDDLYRKLHIVNNKNGYQFVNMIDKDHKKVVISLITFRRQYDLI